MSLDLVRREAFYRYTAFKPREGAVDFDRLAAEYQSTGEANMRSLFSDVVSYPGYASLQPLVVKEFMDTESYRATLASGIWARCARAAR